MAEMAEMAAGKLERQHHLMNPSPPDMPCRDGRLFILGRTENRGRQDSELIICPSDFVSRQHCDICYKNGAFWIKDLKSLNGTFLNGQKILPFTERELRFGDIIGLGVSHLATDVNVEDSQYYIFKFKAQTFEIIDLEESDDEAVGNVVQAIDIPNPPIPLPSPTKSVDSDEEIEIVEEKLSNISKSISPLKSPSISPSKSPSPQLKPLPPAPPPPVISKSRKSKPRSVRSPSLENITSSSSGSALSDHGPSKGSSQKQKSKVQLPGTGTVGSSIKNLANNSAHASIISNSLKIPSGSTSTSKPTRSPQKAGPASFKRKNEANRLKNNFSTPSLLKLSTRGIASVLSNSDEVPEIPSILPKTLHSSGSVISSATVAKNSIPVPNSDNYSKPDSHRSIRSPVVTSSDDSSDGMSESCNQRKLVPNVESSPEYSSMHKFSDEDIEKKSIVPKAKRNGTPRSSTDSNMDKRLNKSENPSSKRKGSNGSPSKSKMNTSNSSDRDPNTSIKQILIDDLKRNQPVVKVCQLILRDDSISTGMLTMKKKKFNALTSKNRQKIAYQFERSCKQNRGLKSARHSFSEENDSSDSSDCREPKKKKKKIDSFDEKERSRSERNRQRKPNSSRAESGIIRSESTDSDSHASENQEPRSKKPKSYFKEKQKVVDVSSKEKESTKAKSSWKDEMKPEEPTCSKYIRINNRSTSPISDQDFSSDNGDANEIDNDEMDTGEHERNVTGVKLQAEQQKKGPRTMQFIKHAPPPPEVARKSKMDSARRRAQMDLENRSTKMTKQASFRIDDKDLRTQKLKEVARKEPQRMQVNSVSPIETQKTRAPVRVKNQANNRNQDLINSMLGSEHIQKELERATIAKLDDEIKEPNNQTPEKTIPAPRREIPYPSPQFQSKMPLQKIQKDMDRYKSDQEAAKMMPPPNLQPGPPVRDPRTLMKKSEDKPISTASSSNPGTSTLMDYKHKLHSIPTAKPMSSNNGANTVKERQQSFRERSLIAEDQIYRIILRWNASWLEEQQRFPDHPPIANEYILHRTLYEYKDYKSYVNIFLPLILYEIWATITQDFSKKRKPIDGRFENDNQEFIVAIDTIFPKSDCPMISQPKNVGGAKKDGDLYWTQIQCHSLTKRSGEISRRMDLAIITLKLNTSEEDDQVKKEKDYFGFVLHQSEHETPLSNSSVILNPQLQKECPNSKFMHSMIIVIHLHHGETISTAELGRMKRISYISPKLRDIKALNCLSYSKLKSHILNPSPPKVLYNPNVIPSQHQLIPQVSKLNSTQKSVVAYVSERVYSDEPELLLLHGPPGTGKTRTIVGMILQLLQCKPKTCSRALRILVCTPSNTALDEVMCRVEEAIKDLPRDREIRMVRLGDTGGAKMKKYCLDTLARKQEEDCSTYTSIRLGITQCEKEIVDKNKEIDDLKKVKHSKTVLESLQRELRELESRRDDYKSEISKQRRDTCSLANARSKVLESAKIVFSTLNSCSNSIASHAFGFKTGKINPFLCCIVDEASQTTEPETLAPLLLQVDKLILVGDPCQLGATVLSTEAEKKDFGLSLFSRLHHYYTKTLKTPNAVMMLTQQYRMHPEILAWPNEYFYKSQLKTHCIGRSEGNVCDVKPYLFLNLSSQESSNRKGQISNSEEVKIVVEIVRNISLMNKKHPDQPLWSIGVITPYSTQKRVIQDKLRKELLAVAESVEVDTVDSFQGREKDIIIISCVRTDETGFLKNPLRLNVALTRAKYSLLMIGDEECLKTVPMWNSLIENAKERNCHYNISGTESSKPGYFRKRIYNLLSPSKSQIPDEQRKKDWMG